MRMVFFKHNAANHRKAKALFGLCKIERSGIHKPNNAFDCPSEFALLAFSLLRLIAYLLAFNA